MGGQLAGGRTVADVGGDLLGTDPIAAWSAAKDAAERAIGATADGDLVTLSAGPTPVGEYLRQLAADHLVHAWDLATAAGTNLPGRARRPSVRDRIALRCR